MNVEIPSLKTRTLTERITLPLDPGTKTELEALKREHGIDTSEWIRRLIKGNLADLRAKAEA